MRNIVKRLPLFLIIVLSLVLVNPINVNAYDENDTISNTPSENNIYSSNDYVIDKFDINIKVNENNVLDITETITAFFYIPRHGIYRTLPLKNEVERLDGKKTRNKVQITNVSVNDEYTTSKELGNYKIKIGNENKTGTGEKTYIIKYSYNLGKDHIKDYDELYYDIVGHSWDTVVGNVTFSITMPKEFDSSKIGFSTGKTRSTDNSKLKYSVDGNKITGSYDGILNAGEGITVRCELPEGYFVGAGIPVSIGTYILIALPVIFLGISVLMWYKLGRDEKAVETVEFYPPEGFNSLEVGFLYKGKANNQDVISLLIYLADKGYIKITETEEQSVFNSKGFKITKLKEYDGNNINEKLFLDGLFANKTSDATLSNLGIPHKVEVNSMELYDKFYVTLRRILSNINTKENKNKIFEKLGSSKIVFIVIMIIVAFCTITIPPILEYAGVFFIPFALIFPGIGFTLMFSLLIGGNPTIYVNGKPTNKSSVVKGFGIFWGCLFGGMPWAFIVLPTLLQDPIYLIGYIVGIACVFGMILCIKYLPKRTKYGTEILGKIKGFKNFLETAEKEKLEAMVMENPTYFYNILPYTYVLGVSDKWIEKFETISMQEPTWYDGSSTFDMMTFGTFMDSTMESAQSAMSSSPSSDFSGGGGSTGGGFSGGGSGGGGGGSW